MPPPNFFISVRNNFNTWKFIIKKKSIRIACFVIFSWLGSMVKNVYGKSVHKTLKLTVSEEWTDGINWFFACWYRFTKTKSWSKYFWGRHGQKWLWLVCSQDYKTDWISKTNRRNKVIFCMLVQIQES